MYAKYVIVLYKILILLNVTYCLRFDRAGWKTIDVNVETLPTPTQTPTPTQQQPSTTTTTTTNSPIITSRHDDFIINNNNNNYQAASINKKQLIRIRSNDNSKLSKDIDDNINRNSILDKKLVQWDDDDFNFSSNLSEDYLLDVPRRKNSTLSENKSLVSIINYQSRLVAKNNSNKGKNRLIYHGQIKKNNKVKLIDGIKLLIDTHQPVSINRQQAAPFKRLASSSSSSPSLFNSNLLTGWQPDNEQYNDEKLSSSSNVSLISFNNNDINKDKDKDKDNRKNPANDNINNNKLLGDDQESSISKSSLSLINFSSSDWKPITVAQARRQRRSKQQHKQLQFRDTHKKINEDDEFKKQLKELTLSDILTTNDKSLDSNENKWKPINITLGISSKSTLTSSKQREKRFQKKNDSLLNRIESKRVGRVSERLIGEKKSPLSNNLLKDSKDHIDPIKESIIYGKKIINQSKTYHSTINEPFDEDDSFIDERSRLQQLKLTNQNQNNNHNNSNFDRRQSIEHNYEYKLTNSSSILPDKEAEEEEELKFNNKWVPLDTTTTTTSAASINNDDLDLNEEKITTELPPPTTTTMASLGLNSTSNTMRSSTNSSTPEIAAQRSASDINYIYSQQPQQQQQQQEAFRQPSGGGSSYYSNYLFPQQQQQQPQQQAAIEQPATLIDQPAIVDTTSGQAPEMIADRVPDAPINALISTDSGYSMPQTSSAFQPAQPPPIRVPFAPSTSYASNYDNNHYYQPQAQAQPQAQMIQAQPVRQPQQQYGYGSNNNNQQQLTQQATTSGPQVVRQEHHYHYYNNNQQQQQQQRSNNLNLDRGGQFVSTQTQPIQSVIREVQPVFISQPIIQQQASTTSTTTTTPAPREIIREIIKEVPMIQTVPTRFITMPAQTISNIPQHQQQQIQFQVQQIRDQALPETATLMQTYAASLAAPAQRVIRQISNSIPTVAVRIPPVVVPQIRLPTIQQAFQQLPVRLASTGASQQQSITRQTASFVIPPMPKKTTTFLTETQAMPTHTTIMHTTQFTPATRTTVYTTDHQQATTNQAALVGSSGAYSSRRKKK